MAPLILIVDDEPDLREILADALTDEGYRVRTASDGQRAVEFLSTDDITAPDVIISDVVMPRMTGVRLVEWLRAGGDETPVILMSATYSGAQLPGVRFLPKPFQLDDLSAAVQLALGYRATCR